MPDPPEWSLLWSNAQSDPLLVWGSNPERDGQLGWWLFWRGRDGGKEVILIAGEKHEQREAETRARQQLDERE